MFHLEKGKFLSIFVLKKNNMSKGFTLNEIRDKKEDSTLEMACNTCNEIKKLKDFSYGKSTNGFYYFQTRCSQCQYQRKKDQFANRLHRYKEIQRNKELNTIEGRAMLLRNRCKQRAKKNSMEFTLTKEHVISILSEGKCSKTGILFDFTNMDYNPYAPSIDRIDSSLGYTNENTQAVCLIYNFCKNKFTEEQVMNFLSEVEL